MIHFVSLLEAAPSRLNADLDQQAAAYFSTRKYGQPCYKRWSHSTKFTSNTTMFDMKVKHCCTSFI